MPNRYDEDDGRMGRYAGGYQDDHDESRGWRGERRRDYQGRYRDDLSRFGRFDDEMEYEGGYHHPRNEEENTGHGRRSSMGGRRDPRGGYDRGEGTYGGTGAEAYGGAGWGGAYGDRQGQYGTASRLWQEPQSRDYGQQGRAWQDQGHEGYGYARQGGYQRPRAFSQSNPRHAHDLNYCDWRDRQNRQFDDDFVAFSAEKQKQFDTEFDQWRRNRSQTTGQFQGQTTGQQSGLASDQMARGSVMTAKPSDEASSKKP